MKRILVIAGLLGLMAVGSAIAETCYTDCRTDSAGNIHCKTTCGDYEY